MKDSLVVSTFLLGIAILLEAAWVIGLRYTEGLSRLTPSFVVLVCYLLCIVPLAILAKSIPTSVLYSIWVGGGILLVAVLDRFVFGVSLSLTQCVFLFLILVGCVGYKLTS